MIGKAVKCNDCKWVHFEVTAEYVHQWKREWAGYCQTETDQWLESYGIKNRRPPSAVKQYCKCFRCGGSYKNFTEAKEGDLPHGSTVQPILRREDKL